MYFVAIFIQYLIQIIIVLIIIRIVLSWFRGPMNSGFQRFIIESTEPFLKPARRITPKLGMIDLSPIVAVIALTVIRDILLYLLTYV